MIIGFFIGGINLELLVVFLVFGLVYLKVFGDFKLRYIFFVGVLFLRLFVWFDFQGVELDFIDNGSVLEIEGVICLEPDIRRDDVRYGLCVDIYGIRRVFWKNSKDDLFEFGDVLSLECILETPFEENGFSYKNYLQIFKIDYICEGRLIGGIKEGYGFRRGILFGKNYMINYFDRELIEPVSSLMNGILFGSRRGFAEDIMDEFARTGLTHIIAVSGYNVALVVLVIEYLFWWVPRNIRFYFLLIALVGFAFLTGLSASVIRACVMGVLTLWGMRAGQKTSFWKVLLFCVFGMGIWNPAYIYFDVSLHLSVLATIGVVLGGKLIDIDEGDDVLGFKEAFYMTIFAQVFTTPLILLKFDYLSLVSPIANVLVAPFLPILMLLGCLLLMVEVFFPFEVFRFGLVLCIEVLGRLFFQIVSLTSKLDFLILELDRFDRGFLVAVYSLIFVAVSVWFAKRKKI